MNCKTLLVQKLVDVGTHLSINTSDLGSLVKKIIILSLKYISKLNIWVHLFPDCNQEDTLHSVDWSILPPNYNAMNDLMFWITLLQNCKWQNTKRLASLQSPLGKMTEALKKAQMYDDDESFCCQLLILHLLQGVPVLHAFERLTCEKLKRNTHQASAILLANLSDCLHTPEEYEKTLKEILSDNVMIINEQDLQEELNRIELYQKNLQILKKEQMKHSFESGRPRLRDLLQNSAQDKLLMDTRLGTWESYVAYCQLQQFPNVLNEISKQKIYFLASQSRWDWRFHVATIIDSSKEMVDKINKYPISTPDLDILELCIQRLRMNGRAPFHELTLFKNKCFVNFPQSHFQKMNLSQFLRLYVCIYQNENIWKDLWMSQGTLFSPQVMKDCEVFVLQNAFNADGFMKHFVE